MANVAHAKQHVSHLARRAQQTREFDEHLLQTMVEFSQLSGLPNQVLDMLQTWSAQCALGASVNGGQHFMPRPRVQSSLMRACKALQQLLS